MPYNFRLERERAITKAACGEPDCASARDSLSTREVFANGASFGGSGVLAGRGDVQRDVPGFASLLVTTNELRLLQPFFEIDIEIRLLHWLLLRHDEWDRFVAMAAIDFEMSVKGQKPAIAVQFAQTNQSGIGQRHRNISVLAH